MDERSSRSEPLGHALQKLLADIKVLASDTRELLRQTADQSGMHFAGLRDRTRETLADVEQYVGPLQQRVAEQARYAADASAEHLRAHRWSTVAGLAAIALGIAAVVAWRSEKPSDRYE